MVMNGDGGGDDDDDDDDDDFNKNFHTEQGEK